MASCERNCFCRCDGSCQAPVAFHAPGWDKMKPETQAAVVNMVEAAATQAARPLFPDGVQDFSAEACAQRRVKII